MILIVTLCILLLFSGLISGSESAFFGLSPSDKDYLKNSELPSSKTAIRLLDKPKDLLATILISNNFVNVGIVIISSSLLANWWPVENTSGEFLGLTMVFWRNVLELVGITFVLLLIGEVIPKIYGTRNSLSFVKFMSKPLRIIDNLPPISWLRIVLVSSGNFIHKYASKKGVKISSDELEQAIALTKEETTSDEEHKILEGIIKFGNTDVKQIMCSRMDVVAFDIEMKYPKVLSEILEHGYSRVPVYKGSFDNVIGILFVKDLLPFLNEDDNFDYTHLLRKPFFVPENKKIDDLLKEFQTRKVHMAVVVDEYGGADGIITLEDILEEIVGDITDEFDDEEIIYTRINENTILFEGRTPLIDVYKVLEIDGKDFEETKGDSDTIGGFIVENSGKILKNKEFILVNDIKLVVESSDKRRVKMVKIIMPKE